MNNKRKEVFKSKDMMTWYDRDEHGQIYLKDNLEDLCYVTAVYCHESGMKLGDIKSHHFQENIATSFVKRVLPRCLDNKQKIKLWEKAARGTFWGQFRWMQTKQTNVKTNQEGNFLVGGIARNRFYEIMDSLSKKG